MREERLREDGSGRVKPLALVPEFRGALILTIGWGMLGSALNIGQMYVLSMIISEVFLSHAGLARTGPWLLCFWCLSAGHALFILAREVSAQHGVICAQVSLRRRVFIHMLRLGPAWVQDERSGELVAVLSEGIERLEAYLARYLPQVVLSALVPLLILLAVFPRDPLSALLLLLTAPLIPLLMMLIGRRAERRSQAQWRALACMSAYFLDVIQGLTTLKLFGRSQDEQQRVARISETFRVKTMATLRLAFLSGAVLEFLTTMAIGLVAVILGVRLINQQIALRDALFLLLLAPEFYRPLRDLGAARHAGLEGRAAAQRLRELLAQTRKTALFSQAVMGTSSLSFAELENKPGQGCASSYQPPWQREGSLEIALHNLVYTYPGSEQPILCELSLVLPPGSCTALVGRSGAGKSTLARLLLRWLQPDKGAIVVNGYPIEQISSVDWRDYVAFVPQRPYLFYGSVRENILLARPSASSEELLKAAELAGALEFIQRLPRGFETPVGEQGARLSAGQVQRIALARAFLKDAPLLILDEPTSNLDPESEQAMRQALIQLARERTVLVIAHRLSTIAAASRVLVLEQGRIVEVVTPDEWLLRLSDISQWSRKPGRGEIMMEMDASALTVSYDGERSCSASSASPPGLGAEKVSALLAMPRQDDKAPSVNVFWRLCKMQMHLAGPVLLTALLGCILVASNLGLLSVAAYLISASSVVGSLALLILPISFVRLLGLVRPLVRYGERSVSHDVTFRLLARLRTCVYACLEPLAPALLLGYRSGDILARLVADIDELQHLYLRLLAPLAVALGISLLVFLVLSSFSPTLAWMALAFLILAAGVVPVFCWWLARGLGSRQLARRAELKAVLLDGIQGMPDLLACGQAGAYLQKIDALDAHLSGLQRRRSWIAGLQEALTDLLRQSALWGLLTLATPLVNAGKIDGIYLGSLAFLILASFEIVPSLAHICQFLDAALAAGRRLFSLLDTTPVVQEPEQPLALPQWQPDQNLDLFFDHVYFSYSHKNEKHDREGKRWWQVGEESGENEDGNRELKAWREVEYKECLGCGDTLRDITLRVPAGGRVAIVGNSGAGKSTLLRLLLRVWDVSAGRITLNGETIDRYALGDLRTLMTVVTQDTYLFNETLRANLLLARPGASEGELMEALDQAQLGAFVRQLPAGLETWIGEQGLRLSAGERQRLAIARALLKDAPILLLDEVTANLDPRTEQEVFTALHTLMNGRTTLLVTHRLVAMECMDEIIVLEDGCIQERGTHTQLLTRQGRYAQLWDFQQSFCISPVEAALVNGRGTGHS
ncbi:MAG TPA: thiol reductant ABC exporter subunit CydD [Ktedonobacteraceae bacterium]